MTTPPVGTVSVLFADIEGSVRLGFAYGDAWYGVLSRYHGLLREAVEGHGGYVFKLVGDGVYAAFARAPDAVEAAIDAQRAVQRAEWSALGDGIDRPRVRMGLHAGEVAWDPASGEYAGSTLHVASRIMEVVHGDQTIVSSAVEALAGVYLQPVARLYPLGVVSLRDVPRPEPLSLLMVDDLVVDVRPPRGLSVDIVPGPATLGDAALDEAVRHTLHWVRRVGDAAPPTPDQERRIRGHRPTDWAGFVAKRVAEWSHPRLRLDRRFVHLTLLLDAGEEGSDGRWVPQPERFHDLRDVLSAGDAPAIVVVGDPGAGKTTLLARFEFDTALDALDGDPRVPFFVPLASYGAGAVDPPDPAAWLAEQWALQNPGLPPLDHLLALGRMVLLLDGLNEMPHNDYGGYWARIQAWRRWLAALHTHYPGCRAIFSCRLQDYAAPLSTPELPIPQVRVEPLDDGQVQRFLTAYAPSRAAALWSVIGSTPALDLLRSPFMLRLFIEQDEAPERIARNPSAWFTALVRRALTRETSRGTRLFGPHGVLTPHDLRRLSQAQDWRSPYELPRGGLLVDGLAELAYQMQSAAGTGDGAQVRLPRAEAFAAVERLGPQAGDVVRAGLALGLLVEDLDRDEIAFAHQLLQEYFAARHVARAPDVRLASAEWRADAIEPSLEVTLAGLATPDPLPPPPPTPWDTTMLLAAPMVPDADRFVRALADVNPTLAARAIAQPDVRVAPPTRQSLAWRLVERSRDPAADLRARIAAGLVLGELGDPRFELRHGPHGDYLMPPLIEVPGGDYPIGCDDGPFGDEEAPAHVVTLQPFAIGQFPVTNAEFQHFVRSGGYEDERWWDTPDARRWRSGEGTADGNRWNVRHRLEQLRAAPEELDDRLVSGTLDRDAYDLWVRRLAMSSSDLQRHLRELYPGGRAVAPRFFGERTLDAGTQPVVGVCWHEARAYCAWLTAQTGLAVRLPSEVEWEGSARGVTGSVYPGGDAFCAGFGNTVEAHVRSTSPAGVFVVGDSALGASDQCGNAFEWTHTAFGHADGLVLGDYPYDVRDGREAVDVASDFPHVMRGGSWRYDARFARGATRLYTHTASRTDTCGFRLGVNRSAA